MDFFCGLDRSGVLDPGQIVSCRGGRRLAVSVSCRFVRFCSGRSFVLCRLK